MPSSLNADNGVVSGTAGLKSSADSSGVLDLQTNGTTAISISASQVVTYTNQPTYTGGTANGVMFLNGSKAVTTGTALTFDGAILGVNGISVGRGAGAVATNTAVGASALAATASGGSNTGIGYLALTALTSGSDNTSAGRSSLASNTTGSTNVAVGVQALQANTTASANTAVGYQAAYSNTTGTLNTAVGAGALYSNTTGASNAGLGVDALLANSSGSFNTAIGRQSLTANTTASANTAVGYQAGYSNTTGVSLTAVGKGALYATTGNNNTAVGTSAGVAVTTGAQNTLIGASAGSALTTGSFNTFIGMNSVGNGGSGESVTTGSKNVILGGFNGNQNGVDIRTLSNYVVLSDGDGYPAFWGQGGSSGYMRLQAGRLEFPATQNASSDANTLDDYEEGTWTPVLRGANTAGSYTLSEATASYVKIGRQVTVNCTIGVSAVSAAGVGYAQITGLPFANSQQAQGPVYFANVNLDASCMWCVVEFISATGQTIVYFDTIRDNTSSLDTDISGFTTNSNLRFTLTYFAST